jgi:adenosylcobyric acid synthase
LEWLPLETVLHPEKVTREIRVPCEFGFEVSGYEIHHGRTIVLEGQGSVRKNSSHDESNSLIEHLGEELGWRKGAVTGVYLHGIFHDDTYRQSFLRALGCDGITGSSATEKMESDLDTLANVLEESGWVQRVVQRFST